MTIATAMMIESRGLFKSLSDSSSSSKNHTCPVKTINDPTQVPFVGDMSFQRFTEILSGASLIISCLFTFFLILRHAMNYTVPTEQKQIIRVIFTVPVFSLVSFLCICFQNAAIYINPIGDLYEAFAFAAFFLLLCAFVREESQHFSTQQKPASLLQTRKTTIQVFQFPLVMFLVFLITEISEAKGTYCDTEIKPYFLKLWCTIFKTLSTIIAFNALIRFYKSVSPLIIHRRPLQKLISFKLIVFLNFVQTLLFSFLTQHLSSTTKLTTLDLTIGIPHLVVSLEMVVFASVFLWVYSAGEYVTPGGNGVKYGGFLGIKALFQAMNVFEFIGMMVKEGRGKGADSFAAQRGEYRNVEMAPLNGDHV